jgi:hypothetical protein
VDRHSLTLTERLGEAARGSTFENLEAMATELWILMSDGMQLVASLSNRYYEQRSQYFVVH